MDAIKKLQQAYKAKQIKRKDYLTQLKELLEGKEIAQEDFDDAADYDPEEDDAKNKPIYTQEDVDRIVVTKARSLIRKTLKDAGVEVNVDNKGLLEEVVKLVSAGQGKVKPDSELQKEVERLTRDLKASGGNADKLKAALLENAVYKALANSDYRPVNVNQVVRALKADYADLIEFDDEGVVVQKSINKAIRRVADSEPNLFHDQDDDEDDDGPGDDGGKAKRKPTEKDDDGPGFRGKGPGGSTAVTAASKKAQYEADKKEALGLLGIKKDEK